MTKTIKEATKEIRNDKVDGHKMYTDMKCTAHGLVRMSFVFARSAGWSHSLVQHFLLVLEVLYFLAFFEELPVFGRHLSLSSLSSRIST